MCLQSIFDESNAVNLPTIDVHVESLHVCPYVYFLVMRLYIMSMQFVHIFLVHLSGLDSRCKRRL